MEGLTAGEEERRAGGEMQEGQKEVTEMVKVSSALNSFELKLFKEEPPLVRMSVFLRSCLYSMCVVCTNYSFLPLYTRCHTNLCIVLTCVHLSSIESG